MSSWPSPQVFFTFGGVRLSGAAQLGQLHLFLIAGAVEAAEQVQLVTGT